MFKITLRTLIVAATFATPCLTFAAQMSPGAPKPLPVFKMSPGAPKPLPVFKLSPGAPKPLPVFKLN